MFVPDTLPSFFLPNDLFSFFFFNDVDHQRVDSIHDLVFILLEHHKLLLFLVLFFTAHSITAEGDAWLLGERGARRRVEAQSPRDTRAVSLAWR